MPAICKRAIIYWIPAIIVSGVIITSLLLGHPSPAFAAPSPNITVQLSPTYPKHTGNQPIAAIGMSAYAQITFQQASDVGWIEGNDNPIIAYAVEVTGDSNPAECSKSRTAITIGLAGYYTSGPGYISRGFQWPQGAGAHRFGSPYYAICLHEQVPASAGTPKDLYTGTASDIGTANSVNLFKVIDDAAPTFVASATKAYVRQTVTVSGTNWLPTYTDDSQTKVAILLGKCNYNNCTYSYTYYTNQDVYPSSNSGSFSVHVTIPVMPAGNYYFFGGSINNPINIGGPGSIVFTVLAGAPPASTPTLPATVEPTPSASSTPTVTTGSQGTGNSNQGTPTAGNNSQGTPVAAITTGTTGPSVANLTPPQSSNGSIWLILVVALFVLGSGTGGFLVLKRRSRTSKSNNGPAITLTHVEDIASENDNA